jgi:hypothetical protein
MIGSSDCDYKRRTHDNLFRHLRALAIRKYGLDIHVFIAWELGMSVWKYRSLCRELL